jgi:cytosine/adenosine deaminase-related metal-dependent hydrolase
MSSGGAQSEQILIRGARCVLDLQESAYASIRITAGRVSRIVKCSSASQPEISGCKEIDLSDFLVLPGLINAHDHLDLSLFPRLADQSYRNYIDWGEDIHLKYPDVIAKYKAVHKDVRVRWGAIRNLLCGVTTVSHHNPLRPEMMSVDFPVKVVQQYGWAHSSALGGNLRMARAETPEDFPFILHACEGIDELARQELFGLDQFGLLDARTVLVHGLAIDPQGVALMIKRHASLIVCPSSNNFLFGTLPNIALLSKIENLALGNDSPLTADGDLLDEIRFAIRFCGVSPTEAFRMVTTAPAAILQLKEGEGSLNESGVADLIAVRDTGHSAADRLGSLTMADVEFVMIGGRVQLVSERILERLSPPTKHGLEPLSIDGTIRWLRAPVRDLLTKSEAVLGRGQVRLGKRMLCIPPCAEQEHVC